MCQWLAHPYVGREGLKQASSAHPLTPTEANSMTTSEKLTLLHALVREGRADPQRLMPGTGACALGDAVTLTKAAVGLGCGGVLLLPPFYYKGVSDEGVYRYVASVVESVADER